MSHRFRAETGEIAFGGGAPAANAVSSSNGTDPKFTEEDLSEVVSNPPGRRTGGTFCVRQHGYSSRYK